jgi:hypothetical protein
MADELDERELDLEEETTFYEDPMYDEDTYFAERLDNAREDEDLDNEDLTTDEAEPASSTVISPDEQVDEFGESVKRADTDEEAPLDYPADEEFEDD